MRKLAWSMVLSVAPLALLCIVLVLTFRSFRGVAIPLTVVALTVVAAFAFMGAVGWGVMGWRMSIVKNGCQNDTDLETLEVSDAEVDATDVTEVEAAGVEVVEEMATEAAELGDADEAADDAAETDEKDD